MDLLTVVLMVVRTVGRSVDSSECSMAGQLVEMMVAQKAEETVGS